MRNNICERSQLEMCFRILSSVDELTIDNNIINEVGKRKTDLAMTFYNY